MKLEINIEKTHFWILLAVIVLLGATAIVFATGYDGTLASHATLFVDTIRGKTGGTVNVNDNLTVTGTMTGNGAGLTGVNAATLGTKTEGQLSVLYAATAPWSGITGMPAGFSDGVDNAGVTSIGCNVYSTYSNTVNALNSPSCTSPAQRTGGGCDLSCAGTLIGSYPQGNVWRCRTTAVSCINAYVVCCNVG